MRILAKDPTKLSYAVRFSAVFKYVGKFCFISAALTLVPFIVSLFLKEFQVATRHGIVFAVFIALALSSTRLKEPENLQDNEAFSIISLTFILISCLGAIPFTAAGLSPLDAWFEAVSAVTTTGLSVLGEKSRAQMIYFSRAFLQWYGGIGIVVMSLGLAMQPSMVAKSLGKGITGKKELKTSVRSFAKEMSFIYGILSLLCLVSLWIFAPSFYDALIQMFTTVSTGGASSGKPFSFFSSPFQFVVIGFCFLSAISFPLYASFRMKGDKFFGDIQFVFLIFFCFLISFLLYFLGDLGLKDAILNGISAQTTAGFATISILDERAGAKLAMIGSMIVGGSTQSTAGGFKILRMCIFFRSVQLIFLKTSLAKHAVTFDEIRGVRLTAEEKESCFSMILLFLSTIFISWLFFVVAGYDPLNSLFEVVSATSTTGLSTGICCTSLLPHLKTVLCIDMFLGRLELVTLITLFLPRTLLGRRMHS